MRENTVERHRLRASAIRKEATHAPNDAAKQILLAAAERWDVEAERVQKSLADRPKPCGRPKMVRKAISAEIIEEPQGRVVVTTYADGVVLRTPVDTNKRPTRRPRLKVQRVKIKDYT